VVGFDLVNTNVRNIIVLRSESSSNWDNGFRASSANSKTLVSKTNVVLQDCIANDNGQKPGCNEGYGYLIDPDVMTVNITGMDNLGGLTNIIPSLTASISADPSQIHSGELSEITVHVTDGSNPVEDATISLSSSNGGTFSWLTYVGSGDYRSTFTAAMVSSQISCSISADVFKTGYDSIIVGTDIIVASTPPVTLPTAPFLASATASNAQIILNWASPSNDGGSSVISYKVYRGTAAGEETLLTIIDNVLAYTDNSVINGQVYYYRVSAVNSIGEGGQSNELSAIPVAAPNGPTLVSAVSDNAQVILGWTAPTINGGSSITNYKVYRGTTSGGEMLIKTIGNVLTYTDTGLTNGQLYYYRVSAVNAVGEGSRSNELSSMPATVPSAPTLASATPGNTQVVLIWTPPSTNGGALITNYHVYRGTISDEETWLTTLGNVLTFTDTGMTNGQIYYYKVSAETSMGEGRLSNEQSARPGAVPTAPSITTATPGNAQISLAWTTPSNNGGSSITNYKLFRGTSSGGEALLTTLGNVLAYIDTSLTNGQTYYYKVSAVNSVGESTLSSEASATPVAPSNVPSAPQSLSASADNSQVVLTWTAPSSNGGAAISAYKVYRGMSSGGEVLLITVGNILTYTNTGLTNGQVYYYKVSAVNSVGEGPLSNEASATPVVPVTVPSAPQSLYASSGNAQVILTWSAPSSNGGAAITAYKVYRSTVSGGENLLTTLGNTLTYTDTGITNGQIYYYKVSAVSSVGEGPQSNEASAIPATAPSYPQGLSASAGNAQVVLTWSAPSSNGGSSISGYKVYMGTNSGGETLFITLGNVLTYTNTGLTNGQTYYYKVSAFNSVGEGTFSNEAIAIPATTPSAPQSSSASSGNAQVVLSWSIPSSNGGASISGYKIYRGTSSGGEALLITLGNVLTYTNTGLTNGQVYYYKVSAVNSVGEGPLSNEASATPVAPATVPSAPQNLIATAGNTQVVLTWSVPSSNGGASVTAYKVYRGTSSGGETLLTTLGNVLIYTNTGLTNGQVYYYKVSAVNSVGEGAQSNEASATPASSTLLPSFTVTSSGSMNYVTSASGQQVYSNSNPTTTIQWAINSLTSGRTTKEKVLVQGNYVLPSSIQPSSYTVIELVGKFTVTASASHIVSAMGKTNIEVIGGEMDGSAQSYKGQSAALLSFTNCQNVIISGRSALDRLKVHDGYTIALESCNFCTVRYSEVHNSTGSAIGADFSNNCLIEENYLHDSGSGVYFYCEDDGIVQHVDNNVMRNNTVKRVTLSGLSISLRGTEDVGNNALIEGNTCIDCGGDGYHPGINIGWSGDSKPTRYATNCTIRNNEVYSTGTTWHWKYSESLNDPYTAGDGILIYGNDNLIKNNLMHDTQDRGMTIYGKRNTIIDNQISRVQTDSQPGLLLCDASNNEVLNNTIDEIGASCIWITTELLTSCSYNHISGNHIGYGSYWIYIQNSGCKGNIVELNTFSGGSSIVNNGASTIIRNNSYV
jgi:predicted phage tail protein